MKTAGGEEEKGRLTKDRKNSPAGENQKLIRTKFTKECGKEKSVRGLCARVQHKKLDQKPLGRGKAVKAKKRNVEKSRMVSS